jgi:hypothetical protein
MTQGYDPNDPGQGGSQPPPPPQYGQQPPQYGQQPPQYGQQPPPYGAQPVPQYGPGGYAPAPATDQMAIISLIVSIGGLVLACPPAGIVSLILGLRSLRKIKESGDTIGGRGLAIAGIAISALDILIMLGIIAFFLIVAISGGFNSSNYGS